MDMSKAKKLKDSDSKIYIERNFKLFAGPGAGKTRFLVNHIKNIITNSNRLIGSKKIACITYTNAGVETIENRLDNATEFIEISTIHSFLYKHVIKPYIWVLKDDFDIDGSLINGHDQVTPRISILKEWKRKTQQLYLNNFEQLKSDLNSLNLIMKDDKMIYRFRFGAKLAIRNDSILEYKKICWEHGLIHHDDVLYLSHKILEKRDRILEILRAKFPYILIDEFQDTNPVQANIIRQIGKKESVVGIIGDEGQSIYGFQGADVNEFIEFTLKGIELYKLENNYRSSQQIIKVLNSVRNSSDFKQVNPDRKQGAKPAVIVGEIDKALEYSQNESSEEVYVLTYSNELSNKIKYSQLKSQIECNIEDLYYLDSSRGWLLANVMKSLEYCRIRDYKKALKHMDKAYRKVEGFFEKDALYNLNNLFNNYDEIYNSTIKEFYNNYIYGNYGIKGKITRGKLHDDVYNKYKYKEIILSINLSDEKQTHITIHKSKGQEFRNVLLIVQDPTKSFEEIRDLSFLLNPNINGNEEHRVYYVALSRAKENLFINVPSLKVENIKKLEENGWRVIFR